jgi:hypothetical protein
MAKTVNAKTANSKSTAKKTTVKETLIKEIRGLIPKLDEEGLAFLVKQAHIHLYNMQVDALNQTIINDVEREKTNKVKTAKKIDVSNENFSDIKISETGAGYHIRCNNQWIALTTGEITKMVKIVLGEGSDQEIRERLYSWLSKERADLLSVAGIVNKFDDGIKPLITLLKMSFKLKKQV